MGVCLENKWNILHDWLRRRSKFEYLIQKLTGEQST